MKMKSIIIRLGIIASIPLLLFGGCFWISNDNPFLLTLRGRRKWKDAAIAKIQKHTEDANWVSNEVAELQSIKNGPSPWSSWLSPDLIVMTNGEWIAYASICRKQSFWIKDIFIGYGSDGKWYYSTYHFCNGMYAMLMDYNMPHRPQPESIAAFSRRHALKEFDGKSNDCLRSTWPVGPYGMRSVSGNGPDGPWAHFTDDEGSVYLILFEGTSHGTGTGSSSGYFVVDGRELSFSLNPDKNTVVVDDQQYDLSNGAFIRVRSENDKFVVHQESLDNPIARTLVAK